MSTSTPATAPDPSTLALTPHGTLHLAAAQALAWLRWRRATVALDLSRALVEG